MVDFHDGSGSTCAGQMDDGNAGPFGMDSGFIAHSSASPPAEVSADVNSARCGRQIEKRNMQEIRLDALMAQRVETGLIFKEMLGIDDALAYWRSSEIPEAIIDRLVNGKRACTTSSVEQDSARPRSPDLPADDRISLFYTNTGRRRDVVGAAVVQAALAIFQELGRERAEQMLRREGLSEAVIDRVFAPHGEGRRSA